MATDKFNDSEKLLLVSLYRERPELWDPTSSDYRDRQKKATAYADISQITNKSIDAIKAQINALRTQYLATHKKLMTRRLPGLHPDETPQKHTEWWLYNELSFLSDAVRIKPFSSVESPLESKFVVNAVSESAESILQAVANGNDSNSYSPSTMSDVDVPGQWSAAAQPADYSIKPHIPSEKRRRIDTEDPLFQCMKNVMKLASTSASNTASMLQPNEGEDDDAVFGKLVATELRRITDQDAKRQLKGRITKLLYEPLKTAEHS